MKNLYWRVARSFVLLLGGMLIGGGLVLHAQIAVATHMREQVSSTFFLWRGIGRLTFWFQDTLTQTAYSAHDVPKTVLDEADRAAWLLVIAGVVVTFTSLLVRPRAGWRKPRKAGKPRKSKR